MGPQQRNINRNTMSTMEQNKKNPLQWNRDMKYALGFSKLWCKAVGVWPWQRNEPSFMARSALFFAIQVAASVSLAERVFMHGNCGTMPDFIDGLSGMTVFMVTAIKILLPWLQQERMRNIIQSAMEDWSTVSEARFRQIMIHYAFLGRLAYIIQIAAAFVIILEMSLYRPPTFLDKMIEHGNLSTRDLILGPSCWIPISTPIGLYVIYYYSTLLALWGAGIVYAGCDAFMVNAALHICGQFEILTASVEVITNENSYFNQKCIITEYVKRHNKLLKLGYQLNDVVNLIILSEFLCNGFLICISGIAILAHAKSGNINDDDINFGIRIYIWYLELFLYTYVGEKLSAQTDKLQMAVYNCPWYNMSASIAGDIKFIIMQNNSSCHLTAGGIIVMNYEAFKDITRLMVSCFSVLKLASFEAFLLRKCHVQFSARRRIFNKYYLAVWKLYSILENRKKKT